MEIYIRDYLHWTLKLTFEERQLIFRIAKKNRIRPSVWLRDFILRELKDYINKHM